MAKCWNGFCVASDCDQVRHVDVTGDAWTERRGDVYCPAHSRYHAPDGCETVAPNGAPPVGTLCAWFMECADPATGFRKHPVLQAVAVCGKHASSP